MSDLIFFGIAFRVNVQTASALAYGDFEEIAQTDFNANGTGPLASPGGDVRPTFHSETLKELAELPDDWPEMQYLTLPTFVGDFRWSPTGWLHVCAPACHTDCSLISWHYQYPVFENDGPANYQP